MLSLLELAQAGAHFGHRKSLTSPKAAKFIFTTKNNVSLINLEQTQRYLEEARRVLNDYRQNNRPILLVGTKKPLRPIIAEISQMYDLNFLSERWFGGFLTNAAHFLEEIKKMNELRQDLNGPKSEKLSKYQRLESEGRLAHYERFLGGVSKLSSMPEMLILACASEDRIALGEANRMKVPLIAIADTDINPEEVTYPIPANDDAPRAVRLILEELFKPETEAVKPKRAVKKVTDSTSKSDQKSAVRPSVKKKTETAVKKAVRKTKKKVQNNR